MAVEKKEVAPEVAPKALDQLRKERNQELVRKMRAGESLSSFDSQASWFPERPKIEKNLEAIQKLYVKDTEQKSENDSTSNSSQNIEAASVVPLARGKQKSSLDKQKR
ncbi:MAG: hypothetical protein WCI18_01740 [Pseudomonadota bacterium]